jgi:hypothetical protein
MIPPPMTIQHDQATCSLYTDAPIGAKLPKYVRRDVLQVDKTNLQARRPAKLMLATIFAPHPSSVRNTGRTLNLLQMMMRSGEPVMPTYYASSFLVWPRSGRLTPPSQEAAWKEYTRQEQLDGRTSGRRPRGWPGRQAERAGDGSCRDAGTT